MTSNRCGKGDGPNDNVVDDVSGGAVDGADALGREHDEHCSPRGSRGGAGLGRGLLLGAGGQVLLDRHQRLLHSLHSLQVSVEAGERVRVKGR